MLQASPQLKDKVQSGNAAASVLRVGSWPWIHLSCSLLSKHYDMPSPKSRVRFLQGSTQLLSILPWPRIFRLWCHEVLASDWLLWQGKLDWLWCHEEVATDESSDQEIPLIPNPPQLSANWMVDTGCHLPVSW
jgi:hypothetical protein